MQYFLLTSLCKRAPEYIALMLHAHGHIQLAAIHFNCGMHTVIFWVGGFLSLHKKISAVSLGCHIEKQILENQF